MRKVNKRFVSDIDQKLREFDRTHQPSASQAAEIAKYKTIDHRRDDPNVSAEQQGDIWDENA